MAVAVGTVALCAAEPPPEQLLPADTLAVVTIPDFQKARTAYEESPTAFWRDPSMQPFVQRVTRHLKDNIFVPMEKDLGVSLSDYTGLPRGQMTLALVRGGWKGEAGQIPAWVFLMDTRDQADQLTERLKDLRSRWVDSGKSIKISELRGIEFTTISLRPEDWTPADGAAAGAIPQVDLTMGQSGSLLLIGNTPSVLERILARQSGGTVPALIDDNRFALDYPARFRQSLVFGWLNMASILETLRSTMETASRNNPSPLGLDPIKIIDAVGIDQIKTLSLSYREEDGDSFGEGFLAIPPESRRGLIKILALEPRDASPPAFVPSDAIQFNRWRLNANRAWADLERMVGQINPQLAGLLQMTVGALGKDKDPNFDFKQRFIGNLGDDFISYQKAPRDTSLEALASPPEIYLIGSPNPEQLATAMRTAEGLMAASPGSGAREREFLGRKIFSLPLPAAPTPEGVSAPEQAIHFAASSGYVAVSTDVALLEEYLRNPGEAAKPLRASRGLQGAAEKVGGMSTGFFAYENSRATIRSTWKTLKTNSGMFNQLLAIPLQQAGTGSDLDEWLDFSLLPPFDRVARYFHFSVFSGGAAADGLSMKFYSPAPPKEGAAD